MRILALLALIVLAYAASKDDDHVDKQALLDYIKVEYSGEMYAQYSTLGILATYPLMALTLRLHSTTIS